MKTQTNTPKSETQGDPRGKGTVLVTDDEPGMRMALREVLTRTGWDVVLAASGEEALDHLRAGEPVDLLITDYRMGGITGLELLRAARKMRPGLPSIMMTAYGTVEDAVQAMREGAGDYLLKPFSFETVVEVVQRVTQAPEGAPSGDAGQSVPSGKTKLDRPRTLIAEAGRMQAVVQLANDVAEADATILLTGESGTGKEVLAQHIHEMSGRRGAFVAVNCAALPEGLLESELFGHEKGAFTGAILTRKGRFEQAQGGTLLLDEISEMPLALQAKLLRVLQEKEVTPVGCSQTIRLDVRVIATTNRELSGMVERGEFRQDLFYRLNVISIDIPPLRERTEDILPLAEHFIRRHRRPGRPELQLDAEVRRHLLNQRWPGNVRELENLIERACLLARGELIGVADLHLPGTAAAVVEHGESAALIDLDEPMTLEEVERRMIMLTLDRTGGNRTRTADLLGVSVRTIRNKLHQYGLTETLESSVA